MTDRGPKQNDAAVDDALAVEAESPDLSGRFVLPDGSVEFRDALGVVVRRVPPPPGLMEPRGSIASPKPPV